VLLFHLIYFHYYTIPNVLNFFSLWWS